MSYRPITDVWILARAKLLGGRTYYGAYPGGFPERARRLLGVRINEPLLHVCGGMARYYPYPGGFGPLDLTLDLDPETKPSYLADCRDRLPCKHHRGILADPPYSPEEAEHYAPGAAAYPSPTKLLANCLDTLYPGERVGMLHFLLPRPPKGTIFVAAVAVIVGFGNRVRILSVFEKETPR